MVIATSPVEFGMKMNNQGVHFIESGHYGQAVSSFSCGLASVKHLLDSLSEDIFQPEPSEAIIDPPIGCKMAGYFCTSTQERSNMGPFRRFDDASSSKGNSVFKNPIFLPKNLMERHWRSAASSLTFTIIYNLALSYQLNAIATDMAPKKLRKALSFYELVYNIQKTENMVLPLMQTMAIINNIGQLHIALNNNEKAQQCFHNLLHTIVIIKYGGEYEISEEIDLFMVNALPHVLKNPAPACAA